jgi:exopolysaccharide production protein ExoZ
MRTTYQVYRRAGIVLNKARSRFEGIQALRGVAALLVVICHACTMFATYHERFGLRLPVLFHRSFSDIGAAGVDIFFVISGFIVTHVAWDRFKEPRFNKDFFARRMIRVAPLYWLCTTAMVFVFLFLPWAIQSGNTTSWIHMLASYFFFPWAQGENKAPILAVGWSLNYEIFFYLIFSLFLPLERSLALIGIASTLALVMLGAVMAQYLSWSPPGVWFFSNTIILEFVFGGILAVIFRHRKIATPYLSIAFSLLGWIGLVTSILQLGFPGPEWRGILLGLPAAFIVAGGLTYPETSWTPKILIKLGDFSYSLYLTHFFVGVIVARTWIKIGLNMPSEILALLMIVLPCLVAFYSYKWIELPLQKFLLKAYGNLKKTQP